MHIAHKYLSSSMAACSASTIQSLYYRPGLVITDLCACMWLLSGTELPEGR